MSNLSTKQLYSLDKNAVERLLEDYHAPLLYFITSFLGERTNAEDILSETIVKLLIKKPTLRDEKALKTYLYITAKHLAIDFLRKQKREKEHLQNQFLFTDQEMFSIEEEISKSEEAKRVTYAMRSLSPAYRQVLYLSYFEELSIAEICKILGKSKKQIYNLLSRAKTSLGNILKKEDTQDEI